MIEKQRANSAGPALPELLAPAGSFEKLVTAIHYGADAVYLGGRQYSLRSKAGNFSDEEIRLAADYAHARGVKLYVTVNIIAHNDDFAGLAAYLKTLRQAGVDALIISDPGILAVAKERVPELALHLSTQANVTNAASARFWFRQGVSRLNLARELSLAEIRSIRSQSSGELEVFVHGALCISYSGRCLLSQYMTGRNANRGNCAHPCRFNYTLVEEKRPGEHFPVDEDERGTYIFNSKDLCLLKRLPEIIAAGADSLKIEGRMKSIFYVGGVVRVYRAALDYLGTLAPQVWKNPERIELPAELLAEIACIGTRGLTENFIDEKPGAAEMLYETSRAEQSCEPVAVIRQAGLQPLVEIRNLLLPGEFIEYMPRGAGTIRLRLAAMQDEKGRDVQRANPGNRLFLVFDSPQADLELHGIFRRRKSG